MTSLARRVERLETGAGGPCPACRGRSGVHIQRDGSPPPVPCPACGAWPTVIVLRRVPERTL
jgi:hypothetical protein